VKPKASEAAIAVGAFASDLKDSSASYFGCRLYSLNTKEDLNLRRIYRTTISLRVFCLVFLVLSLFFSFGAWRGKSTGANNWFDLTIVTVLVLAAAGFAAQTLTACVVLSDDSIRYRSVFRSQFMRLDQIGYRREYEEYHDAVDGGVNVSYLEFVPRSVDDESIKISKGRF